MRLFVDGDDYCDAQIEYISDEPTQIFGQLAAIGAEKRFSLRLNKYLDVKPGDTSKFELRDGDQRVAISPYGRTNTQGEIGALFDAYLPPLNASNGSEAPR